LKPMGKRKKSGRKKKKRSGGSLSALRGTIKSAAGSGSKTPRKKTWKSRFLDILLWGAVLVVAYFVLRSRCAR
jgi:hypothetical protein